MAGCDFIIRDAKQLYCDSGLTPIESKSPQRWPLLHMPILSAVESSLLQNIHFPTGFCHPNLRNVNDHIVSNVTFFGSDVDVGDSLVT